MRWAVLFFGQGRHCFTQNVQITSRENPLVKEAVRLRDDASYRQSSGRIFLEGVRLCQDAMSCGCSMESVWMTDAALEKHGMHFPQAQPISLAVASKLATTTSSQGVFAVCTTPKRSSNFWKPNGYYVALELVQDPSNVGAIARTAEAFAFDGMLCSGGCDIFNQKALRASMGALLRLPIIVCDSLLSALPTTACTRFAAVAHPPSVPPQMCHFAQGGVLLIGNEGRGLSPEVVAASHVQVQIPMRGRAESLNAAAAAAILLWEMQRQRA